MTAIPDSGSDSHNQRGAITLSEIRQQPELWPTTLERVASSNAHSIVRGRPAVVCGAGTSAKKLGHVIVVGSTASDSELGHDFIPVMAPDLPDDLRAPFEIVFPQLLAYHLSMASHLDPDNPSLDGVITRVVQRFQLH